jgi:UDP-glucuronate 4-epimerase
MAITLFARTILRREPITVFGDGSMRRDFTHVDDIVRGVLACLDAPRPGYRVYNLGSGSPVALTALVAALGRAAGVTPTTVAHGPVPRGDVDATFAENSKAREELGWSPRIPLDQGLKTVVAWVRENP